MTTPSCPHPMPPETSAVRTAREMGFERADNSADNMLLQVSICAAYFRTVAHMAFKSGNPDEALAKLLEMHNLKALNELRLMKEAQG